MSFPYNHVFLSLGAALLGILTGRDLIEQSQKVVIQLTPIDESQTSRREVADKSQTSHWRVT